MRTFRSFLQFHRQGEEPLRDDEISILNGVLELNNKKVQALMTPMKVLLSSQILYCRVLSVCGSRMSSRSVQILSSIGKLSMRCEWKWSDAMVCPMADVPHQSAKRILPYPCACSWKASCLSWAVTREEGANDLRLFRGVLLMFVILSCRFTTQARLCLSPSSPCPFFRRPILPSTASKLLTTCKP